MTSSLLNRSLLSAALVALLAPSAGCVAEAGSDSLDDEPMEQEADIAEVSEAIGSSAVGATVITAEYHPWCPNCITGIQLSDSNKAWQGFTATSTGKMTSIWVPANGIVSSSATVNVYTGDGISGAVLYEGQHNLVWNGNSTGYTMNLGANGPSLVAGQKYTFRIRSGVNSIASQGSNNMYPPNLGVWGGDWYNTPQYGYAHIQSMIFEVKVQKYATSCQQIRTADPSAANGDYILDMGGKLAEVYCANMTGTPAEYLTLKIVGGASNFSQFTAGGYRPGTIVRTQYTKVRIDPATLLVNISDQTFATTTGQIQHWSTLVTSMPYGIAMSCNSSPSGVANIDLRATPFAVAPGEFLQGGYAAAGTSTYSSGNQLVNLTGGGECGWTMPSPDIYDPVNTSGTSQLNLTWLNGGSFPTSCAGVRAQSPNAHDGEYTLNLPGGPATIYCHTMAGTPAEYLTLKNVGGSSNFSQFTAGGYRPGTTVRTQYTKVRIDPATLLVNISDQTFATTTGQIQHWSTLVTSMPYGIAMSCNSSPSGVANIDLTGTPFAVAPSEFLQGGYAAAGTSTYSSGNRVVNLTGGGECGWTMPSPDIYDPVNTSGTSQLNLVYAP